MDYDNGLRLEGVSSLLGLSTCTQQNFESCIGKKPERLVSLEKGEKLTITAYNEIRSKDDVSKIRKGDFYVDLMIEGKEGPENYPIHLKDYPVQNETTRGAIERTQVSALSGGRVLSHKDGIFEFSAEDISILNRGKIAKVEFTVKNTSNENVQMVPFSRPYFPGIYFDTGVQVGMSGAVPEINGRQPCTTASTASLDNCFKKGKRTIDIPAHGQSGISVEFKPFFKGLDVRAFDNASYGTFSSAFLYKTESGTINAVNANFADIPVDR
jgi:hypothetical protein